MNVSYEVICKLCGLKFTHTKHSPKGRLRRYCDVCNKTKRNLRIYTITDTKEQ